MNIDPNGGRGIGPDATGTDYPLVAPSAEIAGVLADFYLSHPGIVTPPLSIAWLSGMDQAYNGSASLPAPAGSGTPHTPMHTADVVVVDSTGAVVFDSTTASSFRSSQFSNRLWIYEWANPAAVCRLVQHIALPDASLFVPRPAQIWPTDGRIDARCSELTNASVSAVQGLSSDLRLVGGYNITFAVSTRVLNLRKTTSLLISGSPGSGLGRSPGCIAPEIQVSDLGGATPDSAGNLNIEADGCYWIRPVINQATSPPSIVPGQLVLGSDCPPCCDCEDYVRVGQAISQTFATLLALGEAAAKITCELAKTIACWETQKSCRDNRSVKLNAVAVGSDIEVIAQLCNASESHLTGAVLTVQFTSTAPITVDHNAGVVTDGLGNASVVKGIGTGGIANFSFPDIAPRVSVTAKIHLRVSVSGTATAAITLVASATGSSGDVGTPVTRTLVAGGG